ncbi:MAG: STAS domain-containing protein [Rhizobiaceae bacterium]|nr:STAS domain-containing protein [Rhizobiaceae bacterium]
MSSLKLQETVTGDYAETLASEILANRSKPLEIDASEVRRIDTPCLEVLIAARKQWADEDCQLAYGSMSDQFNSALEILGLQKTMIETGDN